MKVWFLNWPFIKYFDLLQIQTLKLLHKSTAFFGLIAPEFMRFATISKTIICFWYSFPSTVR